MLLLALSTLAEAGVRCGTPQMLQLRDDEAALRVLHRPAEVGYVDSALYPIRVHWRDPADADRAMNLILPLAEHAWQVEVEQMGWPAPPSDGVVGGDEKFDFYLTNDGTYGGAYTFGFGPDVTAGDSWYSVPSYIALDEKWITDADMGAYIAHELNHALQYTIDAREKVLFPWESTAEAVMDMVEDQNDTYIYEIPDFNSYPFMSLLFDGYAKELTQLDNYSLYEYGGSIFSTFLEERYGTKDGAVLLALWDHLAQPDDSQEPDFVDALSMVDPSAPTAAALYAEFSLWRMFAGTRDDGAHFEEGALWDDKSIVGFEATLTPDTLDGLVLVPRANPYELGASYWEIDLTGGSDMTLQVDVAGDAAASWAVVWAVWPSAGGPALTGTVLVDPGQPLSAQLPLSGGSSAVIGIVNGGAPTLEAEVYPVASRAFTATLSLLAPPPEDTGGTTDTDTDPPVDTDPPDTDPPDDTDAVVDGGADEETDEKGGCDTTRGASPWLALLGLAALRRRR